MDSNPHSWCTAAPILSIMMNQSVTSTKIHYVHRIDVVMYERCWFEIYIFGTVTGYMQMSRLQISFECELHYGMLIYSCFSTAPNSQVDIKWKKCKSWGWYKYVCSLMELYTKLFQRILDIVLIWPIYVSMWWLMLYFLYVLKPRMI